MRSLLRKKTTTEGDWRWQLRHAVTRVDELARHLDLTAEELLGARRAEAGPVGFSAYGGWYDGDNFLLGGGAHMGLGPVTFNPNAEYYFLNHATAYSLNLRGTMVVFPAAVASGWLGAGVGFMTVDPDAGSSNTETVFNLLAGAGLNAIPLKPYVQLKFVMQDGDDPTVFTFGVRF